MIKIDTAELKDLERQLELVAKKAIPFAIRQTIYQTAVNARVIARKKLDSNFILRNKWSQNSIQFSPSKPNKITLNVNRMEALMGTAETYLADQEFGVTRTAKGRHGRPIATTFSSGEGRVDRPRRKSPRRMNKMSNIRITRGRRPGATKTQQSIIAIKAAVKAGRKFVFLELERSKGIFRIVGGKRNPRIEMVQDMSRKIIRIDPKPWLRPSAIEAAKGMTEEQIKNLNFQLARHTKAK